MKEEKGLPFTVVRVRPIEFTRVGPTRSRLIKIAGTLAGTSEDAEVPDEAVKTVHFRTSLDGKLRDGAELAVELARVIALAAANASSLVIDLSYDLAETNGTKFPDFAINRAIRDSATQFASLRTLLIHTGAVQRSERFLRTIEDEFDHRILVGVTTSGGVADHPNLEWAVPAALTRALKVGPEDLRSQLAERVVRRRGVFADGGTIEAFRYSAQQGKFELSELLPTYFRNQEIGAIVYESSADPWLKRTIEGAAVNARIDIVNSGSDVEASLGGPSKDGMNAPTLEAIVNRRVCIVIPMLKSGRTARRLRELVERLGVEDIRVVAVMGSTDAGARRRPGYYEGYPRASGVSTRVDYFVPVEHTPLEPHDWRVASALAEGPLEDPAKKWTRPSRTGMLSLFNELGAGKETNVPKRAGAGLGWFPRLGRLRESEFKRDALWLAECLIRVAIKELNRDRPEGTKKIDRRSLLVVVPLDEGNGSRPIARAIRDHLEVEVVSVPRGGIPEQARGPGRRTHQSVEVTPDSLRLPIDVKRRIVEHSSDAVVLADESAVSYGTLQYLARVVTILTRHPPAVSVVAVEAVVDNFAAERPELHSLFSWHPIESA